jgi:hypothetical protein
MAKCAVYNDRMGFCEPLSPGNGEAASATQCPLDRDLGLDQIAAARADPVRMKEKAWRSR